MYALYVGRTPAGQITAPTMGSITAGVAGMMLMLHIPGRQSKLNVSPPDGWFRPGLRFLIKKNCGKIRNGEEARRKTRRKSRMWENCKSGSVRDIEICFSWFK